MQASSLPALAALQRGDLSGARELRLPGLSEFPRDVLGLADTLEVLDLSNGTLTDLPDDIGRLHKLRALFCSGNRFERLPPALGGCAALSQIGFRGVGLREVPAEALPPKLRWLTLTDNRIERLPDEIGARLQLQKLMLAGNRLTALPKSLLGAPNLELIRLSANRFESPLPWLAHSPSLAWISWAGNPFEPGLTAAAATLASWSDIEIGTLLGEGASGRIYQATWRGREAAAPMAVALKHFKGDMTSDGLPEREMLACLAAGGHPNLTSALGRVHDHPEGGKALLMPLLPRHWRTLAGPPSLESCSRDVYAHDFKLSTETARRIARGVGAATAHLHDRGLLHGDLYAHNILWDGAAGDATLSDFGAACALPAGKEAGAWKRIETRAFGLLLGELLERRPANEAEPTGLRALQRACVQENPQSRPLMREVVAAL